MIPANDNEIFFKIYVHFSSVNTPVPQCTLCELGEYSWEPNSNTVYACEAASYVCLHCFALQEKVMNNPTSEQQSPSSEQRSPSSEPQSPKTSEPQSPISELPSPASEPPSPTLEQLQSPTLESLESPTSDPLESPENGEGCEVYHECDEQVDPVEGDKNVTGEDLQSDAQLQTNGELNNKDNNNRQQGMCT